MRKARTYDVARMRAQRRQARKSAEAEAHTRAVLDRRQTRTLDNLATKQGHLLRSIRDAQQRPSLLTAKLLRDMVRNSELPARARAEAAAILTRWAFPDDDGQ